MNLSEDAEARRINCQPWQPLPGMVKLRCTTCFFWFAAPAADLEICPDCAIRLARKATRPARAACDFEAA